MMFDLEGGGRDLGVAEEIHEQLGVEVRNANGAGQALADELLHGLPSFLDSGVSGDDVLAVVRETGRIADGRVDVFEGNGEVDDVEIEIVDAPVLELFLADGLDAVVIVEGVPEFGDEEEVGAFDYTFFDGASDPLAAFGFIAIV